jgi:hypothetical protein
LGSSTTVPFAGAEDVDALGVDWDDHALFARPEKARDTALWLQVARGGVVFD